MTYSSAIDLVRGIKARLAARGLDMDAFSRQTGLEESECMADDALTLSDKLSHLWDLVTQASGDPLLGLKAAQPQPLDKSGLMGHIMRASPDVKTAIENLVRYTPLVSPTVHSTIEQAGGTTRVCLHLPGGQRRVPQQHYDFVWCLVLRTLRGAAGREDLKPLLVNYAYPAPADVKPYIEAFGCEVRFGTAVNAMEFADAALETPIAAGNTMAADWALRMLADLAQAQRNWTVRMLAKLENAPQPEHSFSKRVQALLTSMLAQGEPLREEVAKRLMMSERTLQRRLAEEGTNFTQLVDDTRREMAYQYLKKGDLSLKKLSFQLGFSDPSAFCRACRRWFGRSPKEVQQRPAAPEIMMPRTNPLGQMMPFGRPDTLEQLAQFKPN
ncbi:MAG TPA: AraC family transcriptional regulator [Noviherbaspirillum sp.]|uniref:AraC family transcriptional regulator n=1 Tax=Noviherbaspirillum sp. TaxID=1926288 RepID=UPI002D49DF36|nr:AraC family transcriptional regulator [Noviherbaspirillum sp.]HYD93949.1 AraC family transcriptional regulator [Noviherbaspirillum sp.]